jgi:integrase/recombinase XerD
MTLDFLSLITEYLHQLQDCNFNPRTVKRKREILHRFHKWCSDNNIIHPADLTPKHVLAYSGSLLLSRKQDGSLLRESTRRRSVAEVGLFYRWLLTHNHVLSDPTAQLKVGRSRHRLGDLLTERELDCIMDQPDLRTLTGLRNRTMLETFYATGIRCSELVNLMTHDLSLNSQTLFVRQGKGSKDRIVPIGERGCLWLIRYLADARQSLIQGPDPGYLFLTRWGGPFKPDSVGELVRDYLRRCGITKVGACHLFRRTMATGMLENGADIRTVQAILGHTSLRTTQRYTLLTIRSLKEVYRRTHPFAR